MRLARFAAAAGLIVCLACKKAPDAAAPAGSSAPAGSAAPAAAPDALATVCDTVPPFAETPLNFDAVAMAANDWRQFEFVAARLRPEVNKLMSEYLAYREAHREGTGYSSVFPRPDNYPSLETLGLKASALGGPFVSLVIDGRAVRGGFALKDPSGAFLYGYTNDAGSIVHMGLERPGPGEPQPGDAFRTVVSSAMINGELLLVDWRNGSILDRLDR